MDAGFWAIRNKGSEKRKICDPHHIISHSRGHQWRPPNGHSRTRFAPDKDHRTGLMDISLPIYNQIYTKYFEEQLTIEEMILYLAPPMSRSDCLATVAL